MKNSINNLYQTLIIAGATLAFTATTQAAGFIKFDGIDGESQITQSSSMQHDSATQKLNNRVRSQRTLLLPAVQSAREAARRSSSHTGTVTLIKRRALKVQ